LSSPERSSAPAVEIGVLGPLRIRTSGAWESVSTRQVARLATMLAGWPGELVERERLTQGMWGDEAPATVANTLQAHVSQLRRIIGKSTVQCLGTSYRIDIPSSAVDAEQFTELVHEASRMRRRQHYARAAELLSTARDLWRGVPFPDVLDPDLQGRRAGLEELRDQALEDLLECRLELCQDNFDLAEVIADAKEMISRYPLRERSHLVLVRALSAADRPGEAGAAFVEAAERLRSTMGLDPGEAMVDVHARAMNRDPSILPQAMRTIAIVPHRAWVEPAAAKTAQRVRETITDIGARLVTVREAETDAAEDIAAAVAQAMLPDVSYAVMVTQGKDINSSRIADELASETGNPIADVTRLEDMAGVVLVVVDGGSALRKLLKSMRKWTAAPTVVNVAAAALDIDTEVILDAGRSDGGEPDERSGTHAPTFRSRQRSFARLGA